MKIHPESKILTLSDAEPGQLARQISYGRDGGVVLFVALKVMVVHW